MMSRLVFVGAIALSLAAPAGAQTSTTPTAPRKSWTTIQGAEIDGHKLIGQTVQNEDDDKTVGKIDSVILDPDGKVRKVVMGVGGFLGVGKKDVAVDWRELHIASNGGKVTMNADKDQLEAMPDYVWPRSGRGTVWTARDRDPTVDAPATISSGSTGDTADPTGKDSTPTSTPNR
jgi:hypothetical protein